MRLVVNDQEYDVRHANEALLWVLHDQLGLTGTHYSCGIGRCGSCSVLVDGVVTHSCVTSAASVAGKAVTTIEGVATRGQRGSHDLHPVQQAFLERPLQCMWCIPGHVMSAVALLERTPNPSAEEISAAAGENLCRCGGYNTIRAVVARAAELAGEQP